jgi:hypothetical protein
MYVGQPCFGQGTAPTVVKQTTDSFTFPIPFKLLGLIQTLPQRPTLDDSLARRYYARNRVKSVTLIRLPYFPGGAPDTVEYTELDRAGYAVHTFNPGVKQHVYRRYNRRHQLISYTSEVKNAGSRIVQTTFDPSTKTTTTRVGPTMATLALYQTGHASQHGKDSEYEVFLLAVPQVPPPPVSRILLRNTVMSGDTIRLDVMGYRNEQVVEAESYYAVGRAPYQREGGTIVLPTPGRPHRALEGHYIPNERSSYNAAGWLIRTQTLPPPPQLAAKPVTHISADGNSGMTIRAVTDTSTTTYLRNVDGQLLREEYKQYIPDMPHQRLSQPFSTYEYLPNGLRTKSDKQGMHYEYHYTFY